MTIEIRLISTKVWDLAGIKLATSGSAVGLATDCATVLSMPVIYIPVKMVAV